ncbi:ferredoxin [Streptomyces montanisoli]|uniref:Ferredoxin n=1 Tax=Streptomyces montanisoli TaxID=2798581 RepID=A0A940MF25_9ACTN|nr:ferredoxin [Streptomyces montanisoli]MBP0461879.1 ferredoxin [Streptomyces montanisoli]
MGAWHIEVDENVCVGSGMCAALAPDRFVLEGPAASVVQGAADTDADEVLLDVADSCPASAVTVTDGESGEVLGPRP